MNKSIPRILTFGIVAIACCLFFSGCDYSVPITDTPTRKIDENLLGDWTSKDGKDKMKVVKLDDSNYIVSQNDSLYHVYHSDVAGMAFVTVQDLSETKATYAYWQYELSNDGTLTLRNVSDKLVPDETPDSASVQKILTDNVQNPDLLGDPTEYTKDKD
jgi:hypothetical protein